MLGRGIADLLADLRFRTFSQVRSLLTAPGVMMKLALRPLMQIVFGGPTSEWLCRGMGRHHLPDIVRGGRSRSTRADTEGPPVP